ncbi:beta-1,3-galactosyl-O-glycosyl-glycoprotein beta-1,6-N-acetylglucosaminyltransferase-like [Gouania willdenowi]|uniref:beta-1,3-galactosyl-O-glycosyl-glycoprotein beta-1,6-N-acetylglucosaminyltransferase-like n=1 Tax=Gouania willdenowi TaxID=441366 RepID=UPI001055611F|nr:beta-1,3-galactosyl-O-glycosyl-glycoprotein beta-1,6-N-acetylglucosaminyltransferase-like [Gouania willdenowi]
MQWFRKCRLQCLVKLTVIVGSLELLSLIIKVNTGNGSTHILNYDWLEYTDADGGPERACNCSAILQGDEEAVRQAKILTITKEFRKSIQIPDDFYTSEAQDCRRFKLKRKYLTMPLSKEEEDFPLAFSIIVHHKVQNFERLLRAIYAPHNIYCIHVDQKSPVSVVSAIKAITSCFSNVFLAKRTENVTYASWSRVQADLNCMGELYNSSIKWKYFINLCGQDFPLKTNLEIVRMLRSFKGKNSLESEKMSEGKKGRVNNVFKIVDGHPKNTGKKKEKPPFDLPILSGSAYIVVNRGYIRSVLEDSRIQTLIEWAKDTYSPDEFLWATIQRMPGIPGSRWPHVKHGTTDLNSHARLVKWQWHEGPQGSLEAAYPKCEGTHNREICVYGAGDLPWLLEHHHFFANKFDTDFDAIAVYCLEKYLRQKALSDLQSINLFPLKMW